MKIYIFPGKYHQNGGFSMAMLVYMRVISHEFPEYFPKTPNGVSSLLRPPLTPRSLERWALNLSFLPGKTPGLDPNVSRLQMDIFVIKDQNTWNRQVETTRKSPLLSDYELYENTTTHLKFNLAPKNPISSQKERPTSSFAIIFQGQTFLKLRGCKGLIRPRLKGNQWLINP